MHTSPRNDTLRSRTLERGFDENSRPSPTDIFVSARRVLYR